MNSELAKSKRKARAYQKRKAEEEESKQQQQEGNGEAEKKQKLEKSVVAEKDEGVLEDFEIGASPWVTKKEASEMYCLPAGTLAVCKVTEKDNPRNKGWAKMKLYSREEIRRRARARHGGLEGLKEERNKRAEKRYQKDLAKTKDIFK